MPSDCPDWHDRRAVEGAGPVAFAGRAEAVYGGAPAYAWCDAEYAHPAASSVGSGRTGAARSVSTGAAEGGLQPNPHRGRTQRPALHPVEMGDGSHANARSRKERAICLGWQIGLAFLWRLAAGADSGLLAAGAAHLPSPAPGAIVVASGRTRAGPGDLGPFRRC